MSRGRSWQPQSLPGAGASAMPLFKQKSGNPPSGSLNDDALIRSLLAAAIKASPKSRAQIVDEMSRTLGTRVTEQMMACFTAESKKLHRWPAAWDRAFAEATADMRLLKCRVEAAGLHVIDDDGAALMELGREYLRQKRACENVAALEKQLREVEL